jgi:hypothetical protein
MDTVIQKSAFRLTLPGKWEAEAPEKANFWSFGTANGHESLTVSLFAFKKRLNPHEQRATVDRMVEQHRKVQSKPAGVTPLTLTDTTYGEQGGNAAARYGGVEPARNRRFHALLLCSPVAVTVFYYEAIELSEAESTARARAIMNSIDVPTKFAAEAK